MKQAVDHFIEPKGEFTLIIEDEQRGGSEVDESIELELRKLYIEGATAKEAVAKLSETSGISKNKLYQTWLRLNKGD